MLSLLRTQAEGRKCKKINGKSSQKKDAWGMPRRGGGSPAHLLFLAVFAIDILRAYVHFPCSVWVERRDSIAKESMSNLAKFGQSAVLATPEKNEIPTCAKKKRDTHTHTRSAHIVPKMGEKPKT